MRIKGNVESELKNLMKKKASAISSGGNLEMSVLDLEISTVKSILGEMSKEETSGKSRRELTYFEQVALLKKMVAQREDSAKQYSTIGEDSRADRELMEAAFIERFLPEQLSEDRTREIVREIVAEKDLAGSGMKSMKLVMSEFSDRADIDRKVVSDEAKKLLS